MSDFPLQSPEKFFQPFSGLNAMHAASDWKLMSGHDKYGYVPSNTGGKLVSRRWSKRDCIDPNTFDLSIGVAWHTSEEEARNYYSVLAKQSLPAALSSADLEMPGCDELLVHSIGMLNSDSMLRMAARYRNYVFNMIVLAKSDGYFPSVEAFRPVAKAFGENVRDVLAHA